MNRLSLVTLLLLLAAGCGEPASKMADVPTQEAIDRAEKANKEVEDEERGTPIKKKR